MRFEDVVVGGEKKRGSSSRSGGDEFILTPGGQPGCRTVGRWAGWEGILQLPGWISGFRPRKVNNVPVRN